MADDFASSTTTTGVVTIGGSTTGTIEIDGDQDWFRVSLVEGQVYQFLLNSTGGLSGLDDPVLGLYSASGSFLLEDDDGGVGRNSRIIYTATETGTYYLETQDFLDGTGNYVLSATVIPDDFPATTATTGSVDIGGSAIGSIEFIGDQDWFHVWLIEGQTYQLRLNSDIAPGLTDPYLTLYDASGSIIKANNNDVGSLNSLITFTATKTDIYYLGARANSGGIGNYSISATLVSDDFPATAATTGVVPIGGSAIGSIEISGDLDWFQVTLTAGKIYEFRLNAASESGLGDPRLFLYNSDGGLLAFNYDGDDGHNSRIIFTPSRSATYYLDAGDQYANTGDYIVSAALVIDDFPASSATPGVVTIGGSTAGSIEFDGDQDWLQISLEAGQTYEFRLNSATMDGLDDPQLSLYNNFGGLLAFNNDGDDGLNSSIVYTSSFSGTYYLGASDHLTSTGNYIISAALAADDFPASTATTGVISIGSSTTGSIEFSGDQDWFRVSLVAGQKYEFRLNAASVDGLSDPQLSLYDNFSSLLALNYDGDDGLNSRIVFTPSFSGTYYLEANDTLTSTGNYIISAEFVSDDYPDSTATTGVVAIGGSTTGSIEISGDQDWFKVSLVAGQTYEFRLNSASVSGLSDPELFLYNDFGSLLAVNNDGDDGLNSRIVYTASKSGAYYLGAGDHLTNTGDYTVSAALAADDFPATTATTGVVAAGGSVTGIVEFSGDTDWFKVSLVAGQKYEFRLNAASVDGLGDPFLYLYNSSGSLLAFNNDGDDGLNSRLIYTPAISGTYHIGATGNLASTGNYVVSADSVPDDYPDSTATTGVVAVGGSATGSIEISGDQDWFKVSLVAGQTYEFRLNSTSLSGLSDPQLSLYNNFGGLLASNNDGDDGLNSRILYTPSKSGTYYLGANDHLTNTGDYIVSAALADDDFPASTATTGVVAVGGSATGSIEISGDQDWFQVTLVAGQKYEFRLNSASVDGLSDPQLALYNSFGGLLASNNDGDDGLNSRIVYTPSFSGTYYLGVNGNLTSTGNYIVSTNSVPDDYLNSTATTGIVAVGGSTPGSIEINGDQDWFQVSLVAGQTYEFRLNSTSLSGLGDPQLSLYNNSGSTLASNNDGDDGFNSRILYTPSKSGTYYLGASDHLTNTGDYIVSAALAADDFPASTATTGMVAVGGSATGSIEISDDQDWFQVSLVAGQSYEFRLNSASVDGLSDPQLALYNSFGGLLALNNDGDDGLNSRIAYTPATSGAYYLGANGNLTSIGNYIVSAALAADDFPATTATTGVVAIGSSATGSIETIGDQDWFQVSLIAGQTYEFRLNSAAVSGLGDPYLYLYDSSGSLLTYDDDGGNGLNSLITYLATESGNYYLGAKAYSSGIGNYTISAATATIVDMHPPVANKDLYTVTGNSSLTINALAGVLANDSDMDGDFLTASIVNIPTHGTLGLNADGSFSYTPNPGFIGTDTFTYRASDGTGKSDDAVVEITVSNPITGPEPVPIGLPRTINVFDEGDQITPSVTALSNGTFAVVWVSRGQDGSGDGVYGRIVDTTGAPVSDEFRINTTTTGNQQAPRLAALEGDGFVVVWDSFGQDGDKDAVIARRFGNDGTPTGNETIVNETAASWQIAPDVTRTPGGGYVVAWQSEDQDGSFAGVYARHFGSDDTPLNNEFRLNVETDGYQNYPRIATLADGRLIAVWESEGQDGDGNGVFARLFSADGTPEGTEFQINEYFPSYQSHPDVTPLVEGGFAVAWTSYGQDGDRNGVYTRAFGIDGAPMGSETRVAQTTHDNQENASVVGLSDGTYLVEFTSDGELGGVAHSYMARFNADGSALGLPVAAPTISSAEPSRLSEIAVTSDGAILELSSVKSNSGGGRIDASAAVAEIGLTLIESLGRRAESLNLPQQLSFTYLDSADSIPFARFHDALILKTVTTETDSSSSTDKTAENVIFSIGLGMNAFIAGLDELVEKEFKLLEKGTTKVPVPAIVKLSFFLKDILVNLATTSEKDRSDKVTDAFLNFAVSSVGASAGAIAVGLFTTATFPAVVAAATGAVIFSYAYDKLPEKLKEKIFIVIQTGVGVLTDHAIEFGKSIIDFSAKIWEDFKSTIQEISSNLQEKIDRGMEITTETIQEVVDQLKLAAQQVRDATLDALSGASDDLKNAFVELSSSIETGISEISEKFEELGNTIASTFDSLKTDFSAFIEAAQQLFSGANRPIDPIILDLNRNGVELISVTASNARFDMDADGFAERTAWVAPGDAFLIHDRNRDGIVNDISEFFGSAGIDGFAELEGYDTNRDGMIASDEPIWNQLKLWRDLNGDGNTDPGELIALTDAGITELSVRTAEVRYSVAGNVIPYISTYRDAGGEGVAADAFFQVNQLDSVFDGTSTFAEDFTLDPATLLLPFLRGYGNVPDLYIEMSINPALKDLVTEFVQLSPTDYGQVRELAEQIVYRWARVEDVATDSRGSFVDGRHLGVLEKFFGESFDVTTRSGRFISNDPTTALMGQQLTQSWNMLFESILDNLLVQINFGGIFDNVVYDISTDAPLLIGSLEDTIAAVAANSPADPIDAIKYWQLISPILDRLKNDSGINDSIYLQSLNDALLAHGINYTYDQLRNAMISDGIDNAELIGTERAELFVGSEANESFMGGQGGDVYLLNSLNWGQDRIVEVTSQRDESEDDVIVLPTGITLADISIEKSANGFVLRHIGTDDQIIVQTVNLLAADGDWGIEILRFSDGSEVNVAALLGEMSISSGENAVIEMGNIFSRVVSITDPLDTDNDGWNYRIEWNDGLISEGTVASGATSLNIVRDFGDQTGVFSVIVTVMDGGTEVDTDRFSVTVKKLPPELTINGIASIDEGSSYILSVTGNDPSGDNDLLSYSINWGDGSSIQTLTAAELAALAGNVEHIFPDDESGLINTTSHAISVTVNNGERSTTQTKDLTVIDVAPIIALSGAPSVNEGVTYTLNLGAITDPGIDTVTSYVVNWGDGSSDTFANAGDVAHIYSTVGSHTITVDLTDEDGMHSSAGNLAVLVNDVIPSEIVRIGDAPMFIPSSKPNAWSDAWTNDAIRISHKANYLDSAEIWTSNTLSGVRPIVLAGGDIFRGDIGVSGQSLKTSAIPQEIEGTEALRFDLTKAATSVTIDLNAFNVDQSVRNFEAGRLQLLDSFGSVVDELMFNANASGISKTITLDHVEGFTSAILTAGVYNGDEFVFGGFADAAGHYFSNPIYSHGTWDGSDYLVSAIEFEFGSASLI